MGKPLASLHAGLVARATPRPAPPPAPPATPTWAPVVQMPQPLPRREAPGATPRLHWQAPQVIELRPKQIETRPAELPQLMAPARATAPKRKATTVRLDPNLHARLRLARAQLERTGQSIMVEALNQWLAANERSD